MDKSLQRNVYEPLWQVVRMRCKGNWNTPEGVRENISILTSYLGSMTTPVKKVRVINLLNMVKRGYVSHREFETWQSENMIWHFEQFIGKLPVADVESDVAFFSSDEEAAAKISAVWKTIPEKDRVRIVRDLQMRLDKHINEPREELRRFLDIVREHK